ncbi:rhodanese-like domain-containing protein [Streptomyces sp. NPDC001678]|uniref:rhodanese-like domain-containing protein n=1 Tax=Streptomyces sp. NPDC001678 TaxID=3364599 RepID=UPI0036C29FFE
MREPEGYRAGHVPGAPPVPLAKLPARADAPADRPAYVICGSGGGRSLDATDWMRARGIDARPVAAGTHGRAQAGHLSPPARTRTDLPEAAVRHRPTMAPPCPF